MKDKDGFDIRCEHSEWMIYDGRDNKDFICLRYGSRITGYHHCYCDENCKDYVPIRRVKDVEN